MDELAYRIWKLVAITACFTTLSVSGCTMHQSYAIRQMVAAGADPLEAACAISNQNNHDICLLTATKPSGAAHD